MEERQTFPVENDGRGFSCVVNDLDVLPRKVRADTGPERFGDGLFRGESRGVRGDRVCEGGAVRLFRCGEQSVQEGLTVALDRGAEAFDFNKVEADSKEFPHGASGREIHESDHFPDGFREAGEEAAGDDGVSDIEVDEVGNTANERNVGVVDSVAGVDL